MRTRTFLLGLAAVSMPLTLLTSAATGETGRERMYANQTPYGDPATSSVVAPPAGYELFFVQNVARHGARSMTDTAAETRALAVSNGARRKGALTSKGKKFERELRTFQRAERRIGYGRLSTLGKQEWRGIGRRTAANYKTFLTESAAAGDKIAMQTSPVYRTKQSDHEMRIGLSAHIPNLKYLPRKVDPDFVIEEGSTKAGRAAIETVKRRAAAKKAASNVLRRLYGASYARKLDHQVDKALDIYRIFSTAPGMAGDTKRTFRAYVSVPDAKALAEVMDARNFYRFGPGVSGERSSYRQAEPILDDFFDQLDDRIAGGRTAAVFRHTHGEVTMPFAALIKAPGSGRPARADAAYSYGRNPWRGHVAGRLAGSIEWAAYRNASGKVLVTMRYNEKPVQFSSACEPSSTGAYFYRVAELKNCLT